MTLKNILTFVFLFSVKNIFPCDCLPKPTVSNAIKSADLVIHGQIIKTEYNKKLEQDKQYLDTLSKKRQSKMFGPAIVNEYVVVVVNPFKGATQNDTIIIRTPHDPSANCGLILQN